jgi:hypothetical protein
MATTPNKTILETQTWLKQLGFNPGTPDGIWGNNSEKAYQALLASNIVSNDAVDIPWGKKFTEQEITKLRQVVRNLGLPPHNVQDFMGCMAWETGETFSPSIKSPVSTATGLIQFMKNTAIGLGTTVEALAKMSVVEQLGYVEKHFLPYRKKIQNLGDIYLAILWPAGIGKSDDTVLWQEGDSQFLPNKGIDFNADGKITRLECIQKVRNKLVKGFLPGNVRKAA